MSDKGIIFSAPMVRALLDGRKSQTRRLCAWANNPCSPALTYIVACDEPGWFGDEEGEVQFKAGYAVGDRLYVRENFWPWTGSASGKTIIYAADDEWIDHGSGWRGHPEGITMCSPLRPCIHMPRWASRLTLNVTDVRVQRLQDITEEDALAEGIEPAALTNHWCDYGPEPLPFASPTESYRSLWNALHTKPGETWADNPWVVAVNFDVAHGNIDRSDT